MRETVLSVIALVLIWVCVDLYRKSDFRRKDVNPRKRGSDLLAFTFMVLLTGALVFLSAGYWLSAIFER